MNLLDRKWTHSAARWGAGPSRSPACPRRRALRPACCVSASPPPAGSSASWSEPTARPSPPPASVAWRLRWTVTETFYVTLNSTLTLTPPTPRLTQRTVSCWLQDLRGLLGNQGDPRGKRGVIDVSVGCSIWDDDQPVFLRGNREMNQSRRGGVSVTNLKKNKDLIRVGVLRAGASWFLKANRFLPSRRTWTTYLSYFGLPLDVGELVSELVSLLPNAIKVFFLPL